MKTKTINLEEILLNEFGLMDRKQLEDEVASSICVINAMKEACRQTLELATDNIDSEYCFAYSSERNFYDRIEESITNTINQVV